MTPLPEIIGMFTFLGYLCSFMIACCIEDNLDDSWALNAWLDFCQDSFASDVTGFLVFLLGFLGIGMFLPALAIGYDVFILVQDVPFLLGR